MAAIDRVGALPAVRCDGGRGRLIFALDATGSREAEMRSVSLKIAFHGHFMGEPESPSS